MSVWDSLVGQKPVIDMLSRIAQGDSEPDHPVVADLWTSRIGPFQHGPSIRGGAGKPGSRHER